MSKNISDFCSGVNHIGVPTLDYNKSVAFYEGLGFKKAYIKVNLKETTNCFYSMRIFNN